jgi:uncharacterized repeat protein (TIGR03847 family)
MMRELGRAEHFTAGAIGRPGQRSFYLFTLVAAGPHWFPVEKQQVAALAARSRGLLREAGRPVPEAPPPAMEVAEPSATEFRVGDMAIAYSPEAGLVTVVLEAVEEEVDDAVSFEIDLDQLAAMTAAAFAAVAAGRPICPRCNLPMDPDGHVCPASNGDLRHQRP